MADPLPARLAAAALAAALVPCACAASAQAARTVEHGDRGRTVKSLQRALHLHADGIFGKGTARAVRRFQRGHGLKPDGIVGPSTWRAIRRASAARPSRSSTGARVTSRGSSVTALQRRLGVAADGVYGPDTAVAVERFQAAHGLTRDGIVGPATWQALGLSTGRPVLKPARLHGAGSSGGGIPTAVRLAIRAANHINSFPYRYGGGHAQWDDTGYDCSGSVSYVLHGAGVLRTSRDSSGLMRYGAPGPGRWITVYANPGHAYMVIAGRRYDTSGNAGRRWQPDQRPAGGYTVRHPVGL